MIKNEIMKRVRRIFLMRRLVTPFAFFVAAAVVVVSTVSISHVIANMPAGSLHALAKFYLAAFAHTQIVVKSALVAGLVFAIVTLKGAVDSLRVVRLSSSLQRM